MHTTLDNTCPHWTVTIEPDGRYSCASCGRIQTRDERQAVLDERTRRQRLMDEYRAAVTRARSSPMSPTRWRHLRRQLKSGRATMTEVREFCDEAARRDEEAYRTGAEIGAFLAVLAVFALFAWVLFGVIGIDR